MSKNSKESLPPASLTETLLEAGDAVDAALKEGPPRLSVEEVGTVLSISSGIARFSGLSGVQADEMVEFQGGVLGIAFNLDAGEVGVVMLGPSDNVSAGSRVRRTGRVVDVPVGEGLLGRVIDATARPLDNLGPVPAVERRPIERPAPPIMARSPVTEPLQTGLKVIDALIPVGRGQRELILGDRQVGKTAIALDTIINQQDTGVLCIYCAIGQQGSAVAKFIAQLHRFDAMKYTTVVVAAGEEPPGVRYIAPYAATSIAEYFMELGRDVLIVYDDLTSHARAYRELSLLLERPPGREAYPGDIFYIHSRLLERSTHLREEHGGGSLTAFPIIETQAQNMSAYIPTNLISITDGQIYLSPELFQRNQLPAVDVGKSVSRVGGKTQLPAYRSVTGDLRLAYAQFEELEMFARFGTRLDENTRTAIERGRRVRKILAQPEYRPIPVAEQVAVLLAVTAGVLDGLEVEEIPGAEKKIREVVTAGLPKVCEKIARGEALEAEDREALIGAAREAVSAGQGGDGNGPDGDEALEEKEIPGHDEPDDKELTNGDEEQDGDGAQDEDGEQDGNKEQDEDMRLDRNDKQGEPEASVGEEGPEGAERP